MTKPTDLPAVTTSQRRSSVVGYSARRHLRQHLRDTRESGPQAGTSMSGCGAIPAPSKTRSSRLGRGWRRVVVRAATVISSTTGRSALRIRPAVASRCWSWRSNAMRPIGFGTLSTASSRARSASVVRGFWCGVSEKPEMSWGVPGCLPGLVGRSAARARRLRAGTMRRASRAAPAHRRMRRSRRGRGWRRR
jgi:hypothetical protein